MTTLPANPPSTAPRGGGGQKPGAAASVRRRRVVRTSLAASGEPMLWLTGGALALCVLMILGLLGLIIRMGLGTFWPASVERYELADGRVVMGEVTRRESFAPSPEALAGYDAETRALVETALAEAGGGDDEPTLSRRLVRTGNHRLNGTHFTWVLDASIVEASKPEWAVVLERQTWGRFYGFPAEFRVDGEPVATEPGEVWSRFEAERDGVRRRMAAAEHLQEHDLGRLADRRESARLDVRQTELDLDLPEAWVTAFKARRDAERRAGEVAAAIERGDAGPALAEAAEGRLRASRLKFDRLDALFPEIDEATEQAYAAALADYDATLAETGALDADILAQIRELEAENARYEVRFETATEQETVLPVSMIVRGYAPNQLGFAGEAGVYFSRWGEFLTADPRSANQEGGVFPAIVGTVLLTLIMALLVVPFGVMAALYLREYARGGVVVSFVRIAINNLAGVPSIVFGVFGLGFFCYGVGKFIDGGPSPAAMLPKPTWFLALGITAIVAVAAFLCTIGGVTRPGQPAVGRVKIFRTASGVLWLAASLFGFGLIATTPFFDGFFEARLPNPTFGKTALVWASFTLALLTLPVVIVATEEALAAVPNSMREGSYACGASKWQTIKRIVLPRAMPGVMTGMILAMARGAGEVAPLMVVGAVKFTQELPVSLSPSESFGINRSFMHLGFHIYDLGFQSQNSEASKPLVFTTTLLLVAIVASLNLAAIWLRARLRARFMGMKF